ncbi:MAG: hypothetical protein WBG46_06080 [Nonlabens sp.]
MKLHSVLWIEDDESTIKGLLDIFSEDKEDNGYNLMPHAFESLADFHENSGLDLNAIHMALVCIDFNLPNGVNGNEIINQIRSYPANSTLKIIFYSFSQNELELQSLMAETLEDTRDIYYAHQDDLEDRIKLLLDEIL